MMKSRFVFSAFSALLATGLIIQLNHVAIMHWTSSHAKAGIPCEAATTRAAASTEKCFCCAIEQADKTNKAGGFTPTYIYIILPRGFTITTAQPQEFQKNTSKAGAANSLEKWLVTVVQRK